MAAKNATPAGGRLISAVAKALSEADAVSSFAPEQRLCLAAIYALAGLARESLRF